MLNLMSDFCTSLKYDNMFEINLITYIIMYCGFTILIVLISSWEWLGSCNRMPIDLGRLFQFSSLHYSNFVGWCFNFIVFQVYTNFPEITGVTLTVPTSPTTLAKTATSNMYRYAMLLISDSGIELCCQPRHLVGERGMGEQRLCPLWHVWSAGHGQ